MKLRVYVLALLAVPLAGCAPDLADTPPAEISTVAESMTPSPAPTAEAGDEGAEGEADDGEGEGADITLANTVTVVAEEPAAISDSASGPCDVQSIAADLGVPLSTPHLVVSYCDGRWANFGQDGTDNGTSPFWNGSAWERLTPAGYAFPDERLYPCFSAEDLAAHAPIPSAVYLDVC